MIHVKKQAKPEEAPKSRMLGVTISTHGYIEMALEAAERFRRFTGLNTVILESDNDNGFDLKVRLHEQFPGRQIIFFDADLYAIRKIDVSQFEGKTDFFAVCDPTSVSEHSFVRVDSVNMGLPFDRYVNTGFFVANFADEATVEAFEMAKLAMSEKQSIGICDDTDQSCINYGLMKAKVNLITLPFEYNFFKLAVDWGHYPYIPRTIFMVHAAGYRGPKKKKEMLELHCKVFGEDTFSANPAYYEPLKKGFIVYTPDQKDLAIEAARRALLFANIECDLLQVRTANEAHEMKLRGFLLYDNQEIYLIDNDYWFTQRCSIPLPTKGTIVATQSLGEFIQKRCENCRIDYETYFCSCFVGVYMDDDYKKVIMEALHERSKHPHNQKDEVYHNMAAFHQGIKVNMLPGDEFNFCDNEGLNPKVKVIHAAGRKNKMKFLNQGLTNYDSLRGKK